MSKKSKTLKALDSIIYFCANSIDLVGSWITKKGYLKYYKIKKGDIIVDGGAFFGYFAIFAAKRVGKKGKVIAFEPAPENYYYLKKKVARYNLKNIIPIKKALFNKETKLKLKSGFMFASISHNNRGREILATTLDNELRKLKIKKVDFIKMDIEGTEIKALEGAKKTLESKPQLAIACYHEKNNKTTGEILKPLLSKKGFNIRIGFSLHQTLYSIK